MWKCKLGLRNQQPKTAALRLLWCNEVRWAGAGGIFMKQVWGSRLRAYCNVSNVCPLLTLLGIVVLNLFWLKT